MESICAKYWLCTSSKKKTVHVLPRLIFSFFFIVWLIFRKAHWAWILQDFLGVLFSLNMLKTLRLPSLKVITVLLCTLFIYDIFFVFITPLLTKVFSRNFLCIIILNIGIYSFKYHRMGNL